MNLKQTKQPIMGVAAILIILFHLFPVSRDADIASSITRYIIMTAYIAVDIFLFMSGYMSYFSDIDNYFEYVKRKFLGLYPVVILSCIIYVIMGKLQVGDAFLTLLGVKLFVKGGGSFLWFIPAIMIFYLVAPFIIRFYNKIGSFKALIILLVIWLSSMNLLEKTLENHSANIFLCRIPIILIGVFLAKYEGLWDKKSKSIAAAIMLPVGMFLTWKYGYMLKANFGIQDIFYIIAIPHVMGFLILLDLIFSNLKSELFNFFGKMSLELYCFQMVFGVFLFGVVFKYIHNSILAFFAVFLIIICISYAVIFMRNFVKNRSCLR